MHLDQDLVWTEYLPVMVYLKIRHRTPPFSQPGPRQSGLAVTPICDWGTDDAVWHQLLTDHGKDNSHPVDLLIVKQGQRPTE